MGSGTENDGERVQFWIDRLRGGDDSAREQLLVAAGERLRRLTTRLKKSFPAVDRWEQTDDVYQNASLRLYRSLATVRLTDANHFYRLAAMQVRRELLDLCRRRQGGNGLGPSPSPSAAGHCHAQSPGEPEDVTLNPQVLAQWTEFHRLIETLPPAEREVVDLLWYGGLSHAEAARIADTSTKTIQRRWRSARLRLYEALSGHSFVDL